MPEREIGPLSVTESEREGVRPIKRMFIANRGEIAARAIKACQKRGIIPILPYTFAETDNVAMRMIDAGEEAGYEFAPIEGMSAVETFMDREKMLNAAKFHNADAVFLGYGFLAEDDAFVRMCEQEGIRTLSPDARAMEATGNKIKAREVAKRIRTGRLTRIPVLEGSDNLEKIEDAVKTAENLEYPIMLKDPDMGGGMGNVVARNREQLESAYTTIKSRPENKQVFMERYIENAVHVEVQIAADKHGNVVALGERDCTMQRRSQKVIEESPSPHINDRLREQMMTAAVRMAEEIDYSGVGTWEFIVDRDRKRGRDNAWYFMEVNPRIQVEHPVTEMQTGIDIPDTMIDIAEGRKLPFTQRDIKPRGHTMEVRIYAESPVNNFTPASGNLTILNYPEVKNVRVDKAFEEGDEVTPWFDTTIAKAIAHGRTREEARLALTDFLSQIEIAGVANNASYLKELLETPEFVNKRGTTTFAEKWWGARSREKVHSVKEFVNGGTFVPYEPSFIMDMTKLPQNVVVKRRDGRTESYEESLVRAREKSGKESAAEFGIVDRDGIQFVMYYLDFGFKAGTLGIDESLALTDAVLLASEKNLPLVTICSSGGVEQAQNSSALEMMDTTVANLAHYKVPLHINLYRGSVYGGVPASFAGVADIQMAIDSNDTRIGFTGPYPVARSLGLEPRAKDAYEALGEDGTVHTPLRHFQARNVDILARDLADASSRITHIIHILGIKDSVTNPLIPFKPHEAISFSEASGKASQFDRPGMHFPAWTKRPFQKEFWSKLVHIRRREYESQESSTATISERLSIIENANRPTAADLLDTKSRIFDDVVLLSNPLHIESPESFVEQYPPVIAALAKLNSDTVMVLAHQTQLVTEKANRTRHKRYAPQKPQDWEYTNRMIDFAEKHKLPVVLMADTTGADPTPESEDRNQSHKIAQVLKKVSEYPYPVVSVGIGFGGSGGAKTFLRPVDAAADFENALTFVSQSTVMYWILSGKWIDRNIATDDERRELDTFVEQLRDATAEERLATGQIDEIIKEGKGGAHTSPQVAAFGLKQFLSKSLAELKNYDGRDLIERRISRANRIMYQLSKENNPRN